MAGLLRGKQMVTDATLIEAEAALNSTVKKEDLGKLKMELKAERQSVCEAAIAILIC